MATRPTMGKPIVQGMDNGWYNVLQDGAHYRISPEDYSAHMRAWSDYENSNNGSAQGGSGISNFGNSQNGYPGFGGNAQGGTGAPNFGGNGQVGSGISNFGNGTQNSQGIFQQAAAMADPWAAQRGQYQSALNDLMQGGTSAIAADPSFQNRIKGGQQALERSAAAKGFLGSGNILQALQDYGQEKASEEYGNQFNRLSRLAGVDAGSPTAAAGILSQIPGQNLNESKLGMAQQQLAHQIGMDQSKLGLEQSRFGLEKQQMENELSMFGAQKSMLDQQLADMQMAARQKQAGLEKQLYAPIAYTVDKRMDQPGSASVMQPITSYVNPKTLPGNYVTSQGKTIDQILAERRAQLGLI